MKRILDLLLQCERIFFLTCCIGCFPQKVTKCPCSKIYHQILVLKVLGFSLFVSINAASFPFSSR